MNKRVLIAAVAFFTAFVVSSGFASFFQSEKTERRVYRSSSKKSTKISAFLYRDIANGNEMSIKANVFEPYSKESLVQYADAVNNYVETSGAMDDSRLPADFRAAWNEHLNAWREHSNFLNLQKDSLENEDLNETKVYEIFAEDNQIRETWHKVLHLGEKYGAEVEARYW